MCKKMYENFTSEKKFSLDLYYMKKYEKETNYIKLIKKKLWKLKKSSEIDKIKKLGKVSGSIITFQIDEKIYHTKVKFKILKLKEMEMKIYKKLKKDKHKNILFLSYDDFRDKILTNKIEKKDVIMNHINLKKFKKAMKIINDIYKNIMSYESRLFFAFQYLADLNDRMTFYYRYLNENKINKINNINVIHISKHNDAIEWIFKNEKGDLGTILHFDSHADTNPVIHKKDFYQSFIKKTEYTPNDIYLLNSYCNDIGSVITPLILSYKKNNGFIWMTPKWVPERFSKIDSFIYHDKKTNHAKIISNENTPLYDNSMELYLVDDLKFVPLVDKEVDLVDFNRKKTYLENENAKNKDNIKFTYITAQVRDFDKIFDDISDNYILNLDLDYFVSYGTDSSFDKHVIGYDTESHHRVKTDFHAPYRCPKLITNVPKKFEYEMNLIRWRVNKFLNFIVKLKEKGKKPSTIIICDSTSVDTPFYTHNVKPPVSELSNIFVPKYYAFWLHNTVLGQLKKIFK